MATEITRAFVTTLFSSMEKIGFGETFLDSLSEDVHWTATGNSPLAGEYHGKQSYIDQVLGPLRARLGVSIHPILDQILVDEDWATVLFHTEGLVVQNGIDFSMQYCWLLKVDSERIVRVIGFYDQKKMYDLFAQN